MVFKEYKPNITALSIFSQDCLNDEEKNVCKQLLTSLANFEPYPHERKIRLALSPPLSVSLNLIIQHGPCAISCEGDLNGCNTTKEDRLWPNASIPYYLENCKPSHNYCVTASIGECCPVCTATVFMTDFQKEYDHEDRWKWDSEFMIIVILVLIIIAFSLSLLVVLRNYFRNGLKSRRHKSQNVINDPLTQHILELRTQVVCLYIRENDPLFLDMVCSLQEFLRRKGINVVDIYDEEEHINQSVPRWVETVIKEANSKILLFDTLNTQQLWNGAVMDNQKILKPLEQVIQFTRTCIPVTNVHNYLFFVRFLGMHFDTTALTDLCDGRCYVYPVHRERLANDLKT